MRRLMTAVLGLALLGGVLVGCGLTEEQTKRIAAIGVENEALAVQLEDTYAQVKAGTLTLEEGLKRTKAIKDALHKNIDEVKKLQSEGTGTMGMICAALGMFGRSALHGVAKVIPAAGPWGALLQGVLTLVLGGSETKKAAPKEATTQ